MDNFFTNQMQGSGGKAKRPEGAAGPTGQGTETWTAGQDDNPYRSPMAFSQPVKSDEIRTYDSIGGWLILPAIGLVLTPFLRIFVLIQDVVAFGKLTAGMVGAEVLVGVEFVGNVALLAWGIWTAVLFFGRRETTPRAMIILLSGNMVLCAVETMMIAGLNYGLSPLLGESVADLFKAVIIGGIWIGYFCVSKRVKGTFIQ